MDPPIALVLDDDEAFACAVGDVLRDEGFSVTWANTVDGARRVIETHPIAIVLIDLQLGELRGRHLLDDLAGARHAPPMMILSASEEGPAIAAEFGVACVAKPFHLDELLAAIEVTRSFLVRPVKRTASGRRPAMLVPDAAKKPRSKE